MDTGKQTQDPTGTPPATDPPKEQTPASPKPPVVTGKQSDETVTLSKADHAELIRQRDRNFEAARKANEQTDENIGWVEQQRELEAKGKVVDQQLNDAEFIKKYPHVKREDLMLASGPDEIEAVAIRVERVHEDAKQAALEELQAVDYPKPITPEEAAQQLDALDGASDPDAFDKAIDIQVRTGKK